MNVENKEMKKEKSDPMQSDLNQSKVDASEEVSSYYDEEDYNKDSQKVTKDEKLPSD